MTEETIIKKYYADKHVKHFYNTYWGGDCIHIGIYKPEYLLDNIDVLDSIKNAINNKIELLYSFIIKYIQDFKQLSIADFGAGFGGTSRVIYNKLTDLDLNFIIDNYDISKDNCDKNIEKNKLNNCNIGVYNISFLEIPKKNNYYNVIYSEDAFIHINNRSTIFKEISRLLVPGGYLFFSDIILTDNYNKQDIDEVYKRVNINSLETFNSYIEKANKNNLKYIESFEYKDSMLYHYTNLLNVIDKTDQNKKIIEGLKNWIKHIKLNNITTRLFVFRHS